MPTLQTLAGRSTPVTAAQRTPTADVGTDAIHRDLGNWSANMAIEVRLHPDKLVVSNLGGLSGITADRLGRPGTSTQRNATPNSSKRRGARSCALVAGAVAGGARPSTDWHLLAGPDPLLGAGKPDLR